MGSTRLCSHLNPKRARERRARCKARPPLKGQGKPTSCLCLFAEENVGALLGTPERGRTLGDIRNFTSVASTVSVSVRDDGDDKECKADGGHAVVVLKVVVGLLPLKVMTMAVRLGHAATVLGILGWLLPT